MALEIKACHDCGLLKKIGHSKTRCKACRKADPKKIVTVTPRLRFMVEGVVWEVLEEHDTLPGNWWTQPAVAAERAGVGKWVYGSRFILENKVETKARRKPRKEN